MSRFDYVAYDHDAAGIQEAFKSAAIGVEEFIQKWTKPGRAQSLALIKLEECYMWVGKQIRDDQIARNGSAPLQEGRKNG